MKHVNLKMWAGISFSLWLAVILAVSVLIHAHSQAGGAPGLPPENWPVAGGIHRDRNRPTLVMFIHPHCPCSRASVGELERLMARQQQCLAAQVIFIQPEGRDSAWLKTDLWRTASAIPGVSVCADLDGKETRAFRCETSGDVILYDQSGRLKFHGGITAARGHAGDNAGLDAITAILGGQAGQIRLPVFGCALFDPASQKGEMSCKR